MPQGCPLVDQVDVSGVHVRPLDNISISGVV